ncbi:MAG: hypothetical protein ACRC8Z_00335 [Empedobacter falsenii]
MRQITKYLIFSLAIITLNGCGLFDSGSDTIVDDYEVTWIDLHEQRALYKGEQLVPAYVFAAGYNEKYVFAKQHPLVENDDIIDLNTTNYYIIERTNEVFQDKKIFGPLTEIEFKKMCDKLEIINPKFELTYPTNLKW